MATVTQARAIQRTARQSPYKMRLVIDQIRGMGVNEALALLKFSKKHAALQIAKVLNSAVANAEQAARKDGDSVDVDTLVITHAIVNAPADPARSSPRRRAASMFVTGDPWTSTSRTCAGMFPGSTT